MSDTPEFGQVSIYQHLRALIGTPNAWRTSVELCTELDAVSDNDKLRVQQGLHKLAKDGRITRKTRPGTKIYECMALILDEKDQLRAPRTKAAPPRAEIITPAAGPVGLRQEAVPAPRLPEPTPEAREAVERLVRSPTPALTLADVLAKQKAARQPLRPPATHRCTVCGAHWIHHLDEGSWSLHSETCGACCDNAPMGEQIVPIETPTEVRVVPMNTLGAVTGPLSDSNGPIASASIVNHPYTGLPRDPRDIESDPAGTLCVPGAPLAASHKPLNMAHMERCAADDDAGQPVAGGSDVSPALADELRSFGGLIERGKREQTIILNRDTKLCVLRHLAELAPPLTAYYLREIAADLDRVGA